MISFKLTCFTGWKKHADSLSLARLNLVLLPTCFTISSISGCHWGTLIATQSDVPQFTWGIANMFTQNETESSTGILILGLGINSMLCAHGNKRNNQHVMFTLECFREADWRSENQIPMIGISPRFAHLPMAFQHCINSVGLLPQGTVTHTL